MGGGWDMAMAGTLYGYTVPQEEYQRRMNPCIDVGWYGIANQPPSAGLAGPPGCTGEEGPLSHPTTAATG